ncbi:MAG: M56 family metallopeptidase [Arenibacter latericius]|nr:M56 family metallopeptidase [Arenibacter latericius]
MEDFILYLLKSSGILAFFWCCFKLFLEKETFFKWHRVYLISGIFIALLFPLWTLTEIILVDPLPHTLTETQTSETIILPDATTDWRTVITTIYAIGAMVFLARFGVQLISLNKLIRKGTIIKTDGVTIVETKENTSPFSFFNLIVYNPSLHQPKELETIIAHEKIHCQERHSVDIILIHLLSALQWINPFVWLYKKTLSLNLEYLADNGVTKNMSSPKEYQYLLLKQAGVSSPYSSIINPFFTSLIKKRIVMLNKIKSKKIRAWKFSLVVPFLAFFLVAFNTKTVTQVNPNSVQEKGVTKVEFTIDKTSTAKDLEQISKTLKKDYGVELIFKDISRNAEGFLTAINSSFKSEGGGSGSSSTSNVEGIQPFSFIMEINGDGSFESFGYRMGTKEQGGDEKTSNQSSIPPITRLLKSSLTQDSTLTDPLYIVNGIEVAANFKATDIDPSEIHSVNVLKGSAATNKYGDKAKAGVIEITTKSFHNARTPLKKTEKNKTVSTYQVTINVPLYIVDGVEKEADFNSNDIPASSIERINVTKGEEAIEKFGEKGKHGVIEITTKKD